MSNRKQMADITTEKTENLKIEILRLKELLREVCVRANIIFPEREEDIAMFDEEFGGQHELILTIAATLGLGECDEAATAWNKKYLEKIHKHYKMEGR